MRAWVTAFSAVLLVADPAWTAGFLLWHQGAHAAGRANAFAAAADDPSALYFNPAGITQLEGIQGYIGTHIIFPVSSFTLAGSGHTVNAEGMPIFTPHAYATARLTKILHVGIALNTPYGLKGEWPEESPGRLIVRTIELKTFFVTPLVAIDLSPLNLRNLSLAGGIDLASGIARLERDILVDGGEGSVNFTGDDFSVGGRFGLLYRPPLARAFSLGLMYRLPVAFTLNGDVDFDADDPALRPQLPPDGAGRTEVNAPSVWTAAAGLYISDNLQVEFDWSWTGWYTFEELVLELPGGGAIVATRDWENRFTYRFGIEYAPRPWALRAGYGYDPTPVPETTLDFTLPDVNRHEIALGAGLFLPHGLRVDISGWLFVPRERETGPEPGMPPIKGTYSDFAWVLGFSLGTGAVSPRDTPP